MSVRSNSVRHHHDLAPAFQDILRRNGMQAHLTADAQGVKLLVKGHDSPYMSYRLTPEQLHALTDWGAHSANKKAYNTFAALVGGDFHIPRSYVHAQHANGRVVMGLHGYRAEYQNALHRHHAHMHAPIFGRGLLGWTPRHQPGFHLHRHEGVLFDGGAPFVAERRGGYMKPGELQSGAYGFYYKGGTQGAQQPAAQSQMDVLSELEDIVREEPKVPARPKLEPKPYASLISSPVYFSNEKFQECLSSHGLVVDAEAKTLKVMSEGTTHDFVYNLTDSEVAKLTDNSLSAFSVDERLGVINNVIKDDFAQPVTMETLNGSAALSIKLHPEVEASLSATREQDVAFDSQYQAYLQTQEPQQEQGRQQAVHIDGNALYALNENKAWYRNVKNGREVQVDDIFAHKTAEGTYRMTAVIDGQAVSRDITQKQFDKFAAIDDYHRLKMFDKVFDEVKMKNQPGKGFNLLAALTAGVVVAGEVAGIVHHGGHHHHHHHAPEIYESHHRTTTQGMFIKPGVDTPESIAARAFTMGRIDAEREHMSHHR